MHDLSEDLPVRRLPRHVDAIIHAAGLMGNSGHSSHVRGSVNVDATRQLADYAAGAGATRFIFCSSGGVYAPTERRLTERSAASPQDAYAESKLAAEAALRRFDTMFSVQILRLFFPFGPTQRGRLIPNLVQDVAQGNPVSLRNAAGQPLVTPLYIADLVEYVRRILDLSGSFVANAAGSEAVSIRVLAETIGDILGRKAAFEIKDEGRVCNWWGSNDFISRLTGYSPRVTLKAGLERTIASR